MPVRARSCSSISAISCLPDRLMWRSSSSAVSNPSRTYPPSRASAGGSSVRAASIAVRTSGTSSSSAARLRTSGDCMSPWSTRTRGTAPSDCFSATRSRGPAEPSAVRATRRSRSCTDLSVSRNRPRSVVLNAKSSTASSRSRTRSRESSGRSSHWRSRRPPIAVTVRSISSSREPARPPVADSTTSRCRSVTGSTSSVSEVCRKVAVRT